MVATIQKLKFELLAHPPCSPELGPSDYYLFCPLKEALRASLHVGPRTEGSGAFVAGCSARNLFSEGLRKLVQRWKKCIEKQGECVEK